MYYQNDPASRWPWNNVLNQHPYTTGALFINNLFFNSYYLGPLKNHRLHGIYFSIFEN